MNGAGYGVTHKLAVADDKGQINLTSAATSRCSLFEIDVGTSTTPADAAIDLELNRSTGVGTGGTPLTEQKLDPLTKNAAETSAVGGLWTTDPADGNALLSIGINQRATYRWISHPNFPITAAAVADEGLFWRCVTRSTGTPTLVTTMFWAE